MKIFLSALLLAAAATAQVGGLPGSGRAGTQPPAAEAPPAADARGRAVAVSPAAAGAPSPKDLKYSPLRALQAPKAATFTLPNGMKLYLLEDHDLPVVSGIALVRTGSLLDPPQRIGLAQLAGITLRTGGTTLKTGDQIDALLDNAASNIDSAIGDSLGTFSFTGLKENAPATLQLFKEMLMQPGFRQDKVELAKTQLRAGISHRNDSAKAIAHREFATLIYGKDAAFGWQPEYDTIGRITRTDLRQFHQRYFFPANIALGISGDFDTADMKGLLEKLFADWTVRQPPVPEFAKAKNAPSPGVFLAETKDVAQAFFTVGHLGGRRDDKDCAALEILTGILGGGAQSRIAERLRTKLGIPNDISASWNAGYGNPGLFEISGSTKSVSTVATLKAILEEIDRIRSAEVTEDEWRNARDAAVNSLVFTHDSRAKLFARQMILDYYGYPKDFLPQYQKALQAVTRADLLHAAKQYLNPANLTVVVAGNPAMFGESLEKLGTVTKLDLTIAEAKPEVIESTDASRADGKQILVKAQAAVGGAEKLAAVKDYTMLAEYLIDPSVEEIGGGKIVQTDKWAAPTFFRQDGILPIGRVTAYTDGKVGWVNAPQGWGALTGVQRSHMLGDLFRVYYRLLLSDRIEGRTVNAVDDSSVQITDATGQTTSVEFDLQTHLPKRASYDIQQAGGAAVYTEDVFDDFRDIGGIKVPFKITTNQGGHVFCDVTVKDYKINTGLNPQELARRPQ
jgi:zinc protease